MLKLRREEIIDKGIFFLMAKWMFITPINHNSDVIIKLIYRNKMFGSWQKSQRSQKKQLFQQKFKRRVKYSQPEQRIQTMESDLDNFEVNKNRHHKT